MSVAKIIAYSTVKNKAQYKTDSRVVQKLIDRVNINQLDEKERIPLQYLINLKYTDEELEPLYSIWFAQNSILVNHKNA